MAVGGCLGDFRGTGSGLYAPVFLDIYIVLMFVCFFINYFRTVASVVFMPFYCLLFWYNCFLATPTHLQWG